MNWFDRWLFRRLVHNAINGNSPWIPPSRGMTEVYTEIRKVAAEVWYEDNTATLNEFLTKMHKQSLERTAWDVLKDKDLQ